MNAEDRKAIMAILSPKLGEDLAEDIIKHRKFKKCELTPRGASALMKQYELTGNPVWAAEEHLNRGWQGFKAEWVMKPEQFHDEHNPVKRETREEYLRKHLERNQRQFEPANQPKTGRLPAVHFQNRFKSS